MGVGASAGGLEALSQLLGAVPPHSGLAFVVVQHLDPTRKGLLVELLQRATPMVVQQVEEKVRPKAGHVYVIPPDRDLTLHDGALHLTRAAGPRGHRAPIDAFFGSLADDQQGHAIGVVLSGMGSDGTLGLGRIKEQAGATFVQSPESAGFDGMPRSAIEAGVADVVARPAELAVRIVAYLEHGPRKTERARLAAESRVDLDKLCALLRSQTGHDFSRYKRTTLLRRVERRMGLHQLRRLDQYASYLRKNPQETTLLFKELLIGVTRFFRDPKAWVTLKQRALPMLLSAREPGTALRAWVAGCSTGEEAYSLAMTFKELVGSSRGGARCTLQIFATDLDHDAIAAARRATYPQTIASDVSPARLKRFFVRDRDGYRVKAELREMVIFAHHNVIHDPPFTRLDLVSCRNLLIYLEPELQRSVLSLFRYSLNPGGLLFLGNAEAIGDEGERLAPVELQSRLWRKRQVGSARDWPGLPTSSQARREARAREPVEQVAAPTLQGLADRLLFERYAPPAVLTNAEGDILYVSGRTGRYLEPAAGKANWNIHSMVREPLRYELISAFQEAQRSGQKVMRSGVAVDSESRGRRVDLLVEPLQGPEPLGGMLAVVFVDGGPAPEVRRRSLVGATSATTVRLGRELTHALDELRTTREQMQTSQEELESANEELQSANEELQSTNEELMTSKEEMQSMNEELQTLNQELQAKVEELSRTNDDVRNLLDSTEIATLLLDARLNVRRYTPRVTKIFKLQPSDLNRPITDLSSDLVYPQLLADARTVLQTRAPRQTEARTVDGSWFSVRVMPYLTRDDRVDGVVATFVDITVAKQLEATLRETQEK